MAKTWTVSNKRSVHYTSGTQQEGVTRRMEKDRKNVSSAKYGAGTETPRMICSSPRAAAHSHECSQYCTVRATSTQGVAIIQRGGNIPRDSI
jgi:hypothetical protein